MVVAGESNACTVRTCCRCCRGIRDGKKLKFVIPGGSSMPVVPAELMDTPYDYSSLSKIGSMLGSGAIIVYDETVSVPKLMTRLAHFYAHESCGKCTPCREGTNWLVKIHDRIMAGAGRMEDLDLLLEICNNISGRSFCALGDAAAWPVGGLLNVPGTLGRGAMYYYRHEYEEIIRNSANNRTRSFAPLPMAQV